MGVVCRDVPDSGLVGWVQPEGAVRGPVMPGACHDLV